MSRSRFWRDDISWYGTGRSVDTSHHSRSLAFCLRGSSQHDIDIYVMINAYWEDLTFTIQEGQVGQWKRVIDTALQPPEDICEPCGEVPLPSERYIVKARSIAVFIQPYN